MLEKIFNLGRKIIPKRLFKMGQPIWHYLLAVTGNIIYRFPAKKMVCIGVTGTNGKSTTVELINSVLKETGQKTGMISTVAIEVAGERKDNLTNRTTLGRWQTPKILRDMVKKGCKYAVIEVASEGIVQFRTWGIPFDVAVFTNLSPEHLNTHKTMARYRNVKGKLFANVATSKRKTFGKGKDKIKISKINIANADDKEAKYYTSFPADQHFEYGFKKGDARAINISQNGELSFEVSFKGKKYPVNSGLRGEFNAYNILAAWVVGYSLKMDPKKITEGIKKVTVVPGRMEKVAEKNGASFFIDYAVTPESFELLFKELRKSTKGKLIAVFGATGDRDKSKRPKLGAVAAKMTDVAIMTDEEPYSENPEKIIEEIASGAFKVKTENIYKIIDRKDAIKKAASLAKSGDTVVVTGMGHQKYRNVGKNKKIPWDEGKVIKEVVK